MCGFCHVYINNSGLAIRRGSRHHSIYMPVLQEFDLMIQARMIRNALFVFLAAFSVSACAHRDDGVAVEPRSAATALPGNSVVLIDPSTDDGMLPALGESMSKGAVTIYNLGGSSAPIPVRSADPVLMPASVARPGTASAMPVSLRAPGKLSGGDKDPRVTVFSIDQGVPDVSVAVTPEILTPLPPLPPPKEVAPIPLESPFNAKGEVVAVPVPEKSGTQGGLPTGSSGKKRPPKGMTY